MVGCESVCIESKKSWIFCEEPGGGAGAEELACVGAEIDVEEGAVAFGADDCVAATSQLISPIWRRKLMYQVAQVMESWLNLGLPRHPNFSGILSCYPQSLDRSSIPPEPSPDQLERA
jgi:hypothetical protein